MARVTIEDCTKILSSRFELVVIAAERVKQIASGSKVTVDRHNNKNSVVALREISTGKIDISAIREIIIKKFQRVQKSEFVDKPEEEDLNEEQTELSMSAKPGGINYDNGSNDEGDENDDSIDDKE